jgi:transposase
MIPTVLMASALSSTCDNFPSRKSMVPRKVSRPIRFRRLALTGTAAFGHVGAFAFLGHVPQSVLYDNTRIAVKKITGDGVRIRTNTAESKC